jgi:hypothetical protein
MSKPQTNNVTTIRRDVSGTSTIVVPDSYVPPADKYMLTREGAPLVRLFDVFEWLQRDRSMPAKVAAAQICDALRPLDNEASEWLFECVQNDYPRLVDARAEFCACLRLFVLGDDWVSCDRCPPGLMGLLSVIASSWVDGPDTYGYGVGFDVCLPHAKACELWGWGRAVPVEAEAQAAPAKVDANISGWDEVVAIKKADKNAKLKQPQKKAIAAEFERRDVGNATGIAEAMAAELGISVAAFNKLKQAQPGKREAKNNGITTVVDGQKVS